MRSPGVLCVLAIFGPVQFVKVPLRMQCGHVQTPYGLWNNLRTVLQCRPVWGKYSVEPTSMGAFWTTHDSLWAPYRRKPISESCICLSFSLGLYGPVRVHKSSKHHTNLQRGHPPSLIRVLAMRLIGKQGHKTSSDEQRRLITLS